jgi:ABC-type transport system substrate-binding protein
MQQMRFWKPRVLFLAVPLLLLLVLVGAEAQTPATSGKAKVDRLVLGLIEKYRDYWRPWINGTPDHMIQHDPVFEWLVEVAPDGQYKPWLADSWEMAKDGRSWRVTLHKGVQFHYGYGEFTAKDVVHNHALWCDEKYPGRKDTPYVAYKNGICQVERIEVVNDHEIVMHCNVVCLDWPFYYSSASNVVMFSKAQWDKEGEMAYETKPAATGRISSKSGNQTAMYSLNVPRRRTGSGVWWTGKNCR